jgi:hypothetical protein
LAGTSGRKERRGGIRRYEEGIERKKEMKRKKTKSRPDMNRIHNIKY